MALGPPKEERIEIGKKRLLIHEQHSKAEFIYDAIVKCFREKLDFGELFFLELGGRLIIAHIDRVRACEGVGNYGSEDKEKGAL